MKNAAPMPNSSAQKSDTTAMNSRPAGGGGRIENPSRMPAKGPQAKPSRRERFKQVWGRADFWGKAILILRMTTAVLVVFTFLFNLFMWNWAPFIAILLCILIWFMAVIAFGSPLTTQDLLFMIWWDRSEKQG